MLNAHTMKTLKRSLDFRYANPLPQHQIRAALGLSFEPDIRLHVRQDGKITLVDALTPTGKIWLSRVHLPLERQLSELEPTFDGLTVETIAL